MVDYSAPPAEGQSPDGGRMSRRVANVLLSVGFVSWVAVVFFPVLKYLKPPAETASGGETLLDDASKKKIQQTGFTIVRLGSDRVIVFEDSAKKIHALQAKCTHEGCTVTYKADEQLIWCACHNGKFAFDGRVISGPPPRPLAVFAVQGDLAGKLTIRRQGASPA